MGATQSTTSSCVLKTPRGSLKGIQLSEKTSGKSVYQRFTKVPYALPPVGDLRWRRPQPLPADFSYNTSDGQPGDHTEFGGICPQPPYNHVAALVPNETAAPEPPNVENEDCLFVNIWVPCGPAPKEGWPIQFFIHGGWLQIGNSMQENMEEPFDLLASTDTPRIIVSPTYRLNMFGFLTASALAELNEDPAPGNYGFWDQRCALEWTHANISQFGGNADNITVGGLSAGGNSTFFQLHHDTYLPDSQRIIKRIFLWSNAVGIQPNSFDSKPANDQFDELLTHFNIPLSASTTDKVAQLRQIPSQKLVDSIHSLKLHTFRATTDKSFISPTFLTSIHDGSYAALLRKHNVSVMLGETADEARLYKLVNPPSDHAGLVTQLRNYYPVAVVDTLLAHYPVPPKSEPNPDAWAEIFSRIAADCQVHATTRGFANALLCPPSTTTNNSNESALPLSNLHRYRIKWRAPGLDAWFRPDMGVCHAADQPMWWCSGYRAGYNEEDKRTTTAFLAPFGRFLKGETDVGWGTTSERQIRELSAEGEVQVVEDERWDDGLEDYAVMYRAQQGQ